MHADNEFLRVELPQCAYTYSWPWHNSKNSLLPVIVMLLSVVFSLFLVDLPVPYVLVGHVFTSGLSEANQIAYRSFLEGKDRVYIFPNLRVS